MIDEDNIEFVPEDRKGKEVIYSTIGNKKILNYFLSLMNMKEFNSYIKEIKDQNIDNENKILNKDNLIKDIKTLCKLCALDESFIGPIYRYMMSGQKPNRCVSRPCIAFDRYQIGEEEDPEWIYEKAEKEGVDPEFLDLNPLSYSHPVILRISPYASKNEIMDYIEKMYKYEIKPIQESFKISWIKDNRKKIKSKNKLIEERDNFILKHNDISSKKLATLTNDNFKCNPGYKLIYSDNIAKIRSKNKKLKNS